jgi:hypothetical protein
MERLSNDITAVMKEAETEIERFDLKYGDKIMAYFSEIPTIGGFPYRIIVVEKPDGMIYSGFRQWDTAHNISQWTAGIYNLDRLGIITDEKILPQADAAILKAELLKLEQIELPKNIRNEEAIVLDGSEWKFGVSLAHKNIDYTWKAPTEDINLFIPIIELMRKQYPDKI